MCIRDRVRTDIGTDFESHLVQCRLNQCWFVFVDRRYSNSISNYFLQQVSFDTGSSLSVCSIWLIWSIPRQTSSNAISHTTAGLYYLLITTISCRKHGTYHCHLSLLDQVLTWQVQAPKLLNRSGPVFLWIILTENGDWTPDGTRDWRRNCRYNYG